MILVGLFFVVYNAIEFKNYGLFLLGVFVMVVGLIMAVAYGKGVPLPPRIGCAVFIEVAQIINYV